MKKLSFSDMKRLQSDYDRLCEVQDMVDKCNEKFYSDKEIESFMSELSEKVLNLVVQKQKELVKMQKEFLKEEKHGRT
ncbi:MAG: hypothetical protein LLG05_06590 [Porphyromonadaceae bacterium]|nr:hypothetical protein [Porphyromonadaceae bacterium]